MEILSFLIEDFKDASRRTKQVVAGVLVVVLVGVAVAAPKVYRHFVPEQSVKAFCRTYNEEKQKYLDKYNDPSKDGLDSFVNAVGAMSALVPMFDRLSKTAPDEIQPDVVRLRDAFQRAQDATASSATNPIGGMLASMYIGMMAYDSEKAVDQYIRTNCPTPGSQASAGPSAAGQDPAKLAAITTAKTNLATAVAQLDRDVVVDHDLNYAAIFQETDQAEEYAKTLLGELRQKVAQPHQRECELGQSATWNNYPDSIQSQAGVADTAAYNLPNALNSPAFITESAAKVKTSADALKALDPSAAELQPVDGKLAKAATRVAQYNAANTKAKARMAAQLKRFPTYVATAKRLLKNAC